jgi:hypothetical protein
MGVESRIFTFNGFRFRRSCQVLVAMVSYCLAGPIFMRPCSGLTYRIVYIKWEFDLNTALRKIHRP